MLEFDTKALAVKEITDLGYKWEEIGGTAQGYATQNAWWRAVMAWAEANSLYVYDAIGYGTFPCVMLYKAQCWPARVDSAELINWRSPTIKHIPRAITLIGRIAPNDAEWAAEGRKFRNSGWATEDVAKRIIDMTYLLGGRFHVGS